mmetsp:Transcript_25812/g.81157  ORF Transcript_25812/g.81157 Transcript_25812/m.81157 type:complete len:217 (+) Transcript_25812:525-1175(+)
MRPVLRGRQRLAGRGLDYRPVSARFGVGLGAHEEEDVCLLGHRVFARAERPDLGIVEVVPCAARGHAAGRGVVATLAEVVPAVVGNAGQAVRGPVPLLGGAVAAELHSVRRLDEHVELAEGHGPEVKLKALQVHHQHRRQLPNVNLLFRLHLPLAALAEPAVVAIKQLLRQEGAHGIRNRPHPNIDWHRQVKERLKASGLVPALGAGQGMTLLTLQ